MSDNSLASSSRRRRWEPSPHLLTPYARFTYPPASRSLPLLNSFTTCHPFDLTLAYASSCSPSTLSSEADLDTRRPSTHSGVLATDHPAKHNTALFVITREGRPTSFPFFPRLTLGLSSEKDPALWCHCFFVTPLAVPSRRPVSSTLSIVPASQLRRPIHLLI